MRLFLSSNDQRSSSKLSLVIICFIAKSSERKALILDLNGVIAITAAVNSKLEKLTGVGPFIFGN
jgi:hypothetical protein